MNDHYKAAVDGLNELRAQADAGVHHGEATAVAVIQTRATLSVAQNLDAVLKAQQTANAIAYAHLCHITRQGGKFMDARSQAERLLADEPGMAFSIEEHDF